VNGRTSITVKVRQLGDTYHARTVEGPAGYRRSASSTNSPYFAAHAAADKFFQPRANQVIVMNPTLDQNQFEDSYTATLAKKGGAS